MVALFSDVRVGDPIRHEALAVFPLFADPAGSVEYDLSDEAMKRGSVIVEELPQGQSVPTLSVENKGDVRVLFLEGEQLVGAKQNRILNTSVLVAARSRMPIPVSCCEQGRWSGPSSRFSHGYSHSSPKLRKVLKESVHQSLKAHAGYQSDQEGVWNEIDRQAAALHSASPTHAMHDTYEAYRRRLDEYRERLKYVEGAVGAAVAVAGKLVAIDLFDQPKTCARVWDRLLSGTILDALEVSTVDRQVPSADIAEALCRLRDLRWEPVPPVGEGQEYRADAPISARASALVLEGTLVHGSVLFD
jgi:hypothetical protein